jgi:hypothetical protein
VAEVVGLISNADQSMGPPITHETTPAA